MCGIAGFFGPTMARAEQRAVLARMCGLIAHRGPDDEGFYLEGGLGIGMRRLAIIDLEAGHQPIANEDGSVWIVFNGEIYNYRELRAELLARGHVFQTSSDTETIIHLYEELGERCVERLRGMFAFAIYDRKKQLLLLARDRVGKKPLHYALAGETLIFGSEIKSLLQHPAIRREVSFEAISDYLTFGYVPDPATAFRGIWKLEPGHTLTFHNGRIRTRRYWDFEFEASQPARDETYYVERLRELLRESVRLRLISDVPLGAFLSGGIDSSTVVALMAREMNQPVKTFSIGFTEAGFDELRSARLTAQHFGTEHHEFVVTPDACRLVDEIVRHHDEPFADVSSIPTYLVSQLASEHVRVVLSGDGGDELFAGYERYVTDRERARFERLPRWMRRLMRMASDALPRAAYGKRFLRNVALDADARYVDSLSYFNEEAKRELLAGSLRRLCQGHDSAARFRRLYEQTQSSEALDRLLCLDSKTYLPGDILTKVDRMSMAHSVEARAPLLDHKLIEFALTIPASLKLRGTTTKYIFKQAVADLIPRELLNRPKQGFDVPISHWFRHELRDLLHTTLTERRTRQRGWFNQRAVETLIAEHQRGRRNNARHLWGLLMLELWQRSYLDAPAPELSVSAAEAIPVFA
ncbi:MAG TPA: asparagine synthase (glutamine-hydrolyzing) [Blastocatellia bacterium]|nr:asparagine synthase (glutamine-hydrolyzing) [Blastocatellia bacterium]